MVQPDDTDAKLHLIRGRRRRRIDLQQLGLAIGEQPKGADHGHREEVLGSFMPAQ